MRRRDGRRCQRQCDACLNGVGAVVPLTSLPVRLLRGLPLWRKPAKRKQPTKRVRDKEAFYRSAQWRALSKACRERDGVNCLDCGEEGNQAAHRWYRKTLEETRLEDLKWSCGPCNLGEHDRRIVRGVLGT